MSDDDDFSNLEEKYGLITSINVVDYWKFEFTLRVETDKGMNLEVRTGGDYNDIYRYDPFNRNWGEHLSAEIQWINKK